MYISPCVIGIGNANLTAGIYNTNNIVLQVSYIEIFLPVIKQSNQFIIGVVTVINRCVSSGFTGDFTAV